MTDDGDNGTDETLELDGQAQEAIEIASNSLVANDTAHELYHNDPCPEPSLSASVAKVLITRSPLHAWSCHPRLGGRPWKQTATMTMGSLIHAILLGVGPKIVVVDADNFKTKKAQAARDQALKDRQIPITRVAFAKALNVAQELIEGPNGFRVQGFWPLVGDKERVFTWQSDGGIWCRSMLDCVDVQKGSALITDLKSTESAHPEAARRSMENYGYDIQQATYTEAVAANHPKLAGRVGFLFLFFELEAPFAVTPIEGAGTMRELGERRWGRAKRTWRECLTANKWPGYAASEPVRVEASGWALSQEMEHEYVENL